MAKRKKFEPILPFGRLLSVKEAADLLGFEPNSIRSVRQRNGWIEGVHFAKKGRIYRYFELAIKHWDANSAQDHETWVLNCLQGKIVDCDEAIATLVAQFGEDTVESSIQRYRRDRNNGKRDIQSADREAVAS